MPRRTAHAKINLGLHVLRKRTDGFHDIQTVFVPIPWADVLHAGPADDVTMTSSDEALPIDDRNLVMKAAALLQQAYDPQHGVTFHLEKHIPCGAGLGGGSSDAAAALILLNSLWKLELSPEDLKEVALRLGSDVPFFLGSEAALGHGRGEMLEPLIDSRTGEPFRPAYPLVVAVPAVHVSTAEAFAIVVPDANSRPDLRDVVLSNDLATWSRDLANDFENPIFSKYPAIRELKLSLKAAGAGYVSLSGSGSAIYGFFTEDDLATAAAETLEDSGNRVWVGRV